MSSTISEGFLPTAFSGPAWDQARAQHAQPHSAEAAQAAAALQDLLGRYAYTVDRGDLDAVVRFFTDDCVIDTANGPVGGTAAIRAHYERMFRETPRRFHLFANPVVRMSDDLGSGRITTYFLAVLQKDGEPPRIAGGMVADRAVQGEDGWRIRARSIALDVSCGLAALTDRT